jgi:hypothetical protein
MRTAIVIATGLVALTAGAVAHADRKADQKFCAAAAEYRSDIAELNSIGPHSTVAELRAATDRLDKPVNDMQKAADKMKTPTAKHFTESMKQLKVDVNSIPDDATLEQARAKIRGDIQNAQDAGRQVATEAGCPPPAPQP